MFGVYGLSVYKLFFTYLVLCCLVWYALAIFFGGCTRYRHGNCDRVVIVMGNRVLRHVPK